MYAALSTAVAVFGARATGEGQHLDVSCTEAAAAWAAPFALSRHGRAGPGGNPLVTGDNDVFVLACGRRLTLATFEDKFWIAFRQRFADRFPALADDAYDRRADRTRAKEKVRALLADVFARHDLAWWSAALSGLDVPWAPVHESAQEFLADEHVVARGLVGTVPGPPGGDPRPQVRFPVLFGSGLDSLRGALPRTASTPPRCWRRSTPQTDDMRSHSDRPNRTGSEREPATARRLVRRADGRGPLADRTIGALLRETVARRPDAVALRGVPDGGGPAGQWTYAELLAEARSVASGILARVPRAAGSPSGRPTSPSGPCSRTRRRSPG